MTADTGQRPAPVIDTVAIDAELLALLTACHLPVDDITDDRPLTFFGCRDAGRLVAVVGVETGIDATLLRSLAVAPAARGNGLGRRLVKFVEHVSAVHGDAELYLLTATAGDFFRRLDYADIERERAPRSIRASDQFTRLCPADADLLVKSLVRV